MKLFLRVIRKIILVILAGMAFLLGAIWLNQYLPNPWKATSFNDLLRAEFGTRNIGCDVEWEQSPSSWWELFVVSEYLQITHAQWSDRREGLREIKWIFGNYYFTRRIDIGVNPVHRWDYYHDYFTPERDKMSRYRYLHQGTAWTIALPVHWVVLALGIYPSIAGVLAFRRWRQRNPDGCKSCGYDLTGNESGMCPECGEAIPIQVEKPGSAHGNDEFTPDNVISTS